MSKHKAKYKNYFFNFLRFFGEHNRNTGLKKFSQFWDTYLNIIKHVKKKIKIKQRIPLGYDSIFALFRQQHEKHFNEKFEDTSSQASTSIGGSSVASSVTFATKKKLAFGFGGRKKDREDSRSVSSQFID